jgi:tungstate transport system permease protein
VKGLEEIASALVRAVELIVSLNPEVMEVAFRSLVISISSTLMASVLALPLGGLIHFREFKGKTATINLIQTLYSLPTVIVGLLVFLFISRSGPLGGLGLLFTPIGMALGQTILILPILIGLTVAALDGVSPQIRDTAISLGADELQTIITISREARAALLSAILLGFGRALSEVGVAMMIGGNIRGFTRVLTTAIALETSMGNLELSLALGIILLSLSLVVNLTLNWMRGS